MTARLACSPSRKGERKRLQHPASQSDHETRDNFDKPGPCQHGPRQPDSTLVEAESNRTGSAITVPGIGVATSPHAPPDGADTGTLARERR